MIFVFTVITPDYIDQAWVLMNGMVVANDTNRAIHCAIFVVGVDALPNSNGYSDSIEIMAVEDCLDETLLQNIVHQYTPAEVCWALKPLLAKFALEKYQQIFYFDSDMYFYGHVGALCEELGDAPILLTPHYLTPFPLGCESPNDLTLLRSGVFNAGFFGLNRSDTATQFLDWWAKRVCKWGRNDPDNGMCGDQKWLDLTVVLFPSTKVSRHWGFNVAYWNLYERNLHLVEGVAKCGDVDLVFFHFSGFNGSQPHHISKHQNRHAVQPYQWLFSSYAQKLREMPPLPLTGKRYKYKKWWHSHVKWYRKWQDLWNNPRK